MSKHMQNRPLSPHLTIYRPQLNSVLSILHRITGIALSITLLILIGFFISLIFGEKIFLVFSSYFNSVVGKLIMFFSLCGIWYHFFAGIRHLFWDMGYGLDIKDSYISGYLVILFSIAVTIIISLMFM